MIIDKNLVLSDAQTITVTTNSTNIVDTIAAGFAFNDEVWAQFLVDTLFAAGTAGTTLVLALQMAQDTAFATVSTILSKTLSAAAVATWGAAGKCYNFKLPTDVATLDYRYLRALYTVTNAFSAGKIDCRLVKDIDITMDKVL